MSESRRKPSRGLQENQILKNGLSSSEGMPLNSIAEALLDASTMHVAAHLRKSDGVFIRDPFAFLRCWLLNFYLDALGCAYSQLVSTPASVWRDPSTICCGH